MYMIQEFIENENMELTNTKNTTILLNEGGDNFFFAHVFGKPKYQQLVDVHTPFIRRTIAKLK